LFLSDVGAWFRKAILLEPELKADSNFFLNCLYGVLLIGGLVVIMIGLLFYEK